MARTDRFIPGSYYYMVHYLDDDLLIPEVMTLRFTGTASGDEGEPLWLFEPSAQDAETPKGTPLGVTESQLHQVLDFSALLAVFQELQGFHPPEMMLGNKLRPEDVLRLHALIPRLGQFFADPKRHAQIGIRYTDDCIFLERTAGAVELHVYTHPLRAPFEDRELTAVLGRRGIPPKTDYLADRGRTRVLQYQLPSNVQQVAEICAELFATAYNITDSDELAFTLREDWSQPEKDQA